MKKKILLIFLLAFALTGCGSSKDADANGTDAPQVVAPNGTYTGNLDDGVQEFLGIRYAASVERWKAPKDVTTTSDDKINATQWGPCCMMPWDDVEISSQGELSEDCLNLNIWTKDVAIKGKPVIVFLHGQAEYGGSHDPLYYGDTFARNLPKGEDVVYVTINYRNNIFGSMDLSALKGYTDEYKDSVNVWALDQTQALKWINKNIKAFGGDPDNVTLQGQSSGGMSAVYLMSMPEATQYFQKAIIESGAPFVSQMTSEKKIESSQKAFSIMGVSSMDEILALSDSEIRDKYMKKIFEECDVKERVTDGRVISATWWDDIRNGAAKNIKLMIGGTNGENDWIVRDFDTGKVLTDESVVWDRIVERLANRGNAKYLLTPVGHEDVIKNVLALSDDKVRKMADIENEMTYTQGSEYIAEAQSKWNDVYLYYWTFAPDPQSVKDFKGADAETSPYGRALHCMDLIFAFGNTEDGYSELSGDPSKLPEKLSPMTQATWYAFAKTGDPNNEMIPTWEKYNTDTMSTMVMDAKWSLQNDPREDRAILEAIRPIGEEE